MKKVLEFLLLNLLFGVGSIQLSSAQTARNIFDAQSPITYIGIDFTMAKVIGETSDATDIRDHQFPAINNLVMSQPAKYNIAEALHRSEVPSELDQVNTRNRAIPVQQIKSNLPGDFAHLSVNDINKLVSTYNFSGKTGIALLFVVDGMSKPEKAANIYITFVNMANKRVLFTERIKVNAGGFGFRDYWAKSIEEALKKIKTSKYEEWKKKYAP